MMHFRLLLEEFYAFSARRDRDLDRIFLAGDFFGRRKEIGYHFQGGQSAHRCIFFALIIVFSFALVLFQGNNLGFSAAGVFCGKAQRAGNGPIIAKRCNAASGYHSSARRVGLSTPIAALRLLRRTKAIRCETRLAMNCLVLGRTTSTYCKHRTPWPAILAMCVGGG